jgi:hypothetical protein
MKSLRLPALVAILALAPVSLSFAKTIDAKTDRVEPVETVEIAQIGCPVLWRC